MKLRNNIAVSDSGFVFNTNTGESYSINPTGLEMLKYMQIGMEPQEIKSKMLEKYDVSEMAFNQAYIEFLQTLEKYSLFD